MTYPGSGGQWQPEQNPQPWTGQQPQYGGQQYGDQQQHGQQPGQQYGYGAQPTSAYPVHYPPQGYVTQPPPKRRRGLIIGIVVAVIVVAGGAGATVWALNRSTQAGSATPQAAVAKLAADVTAGDVLGLQSDIAPAEASAFKDISADASNQMKRLQIVNPGYNPQSPSLNSASGLSASGLTFDNNAAQTINDHLVINKLTAGKITISPRLDGSMFTQQFLHAAFPNGLPKAQTNTVDIADVVRQTGQPVRIATIKVNGGWYTSLFYTAADYALESARQAWPSTPIPALGADSADDAVRGFVQDLLNANYLGAIELTDPNEMAVLHDAGPAILNSLHQASPSGIKIDSATFTDKPVTGGVDTVVQSATLEQDGDQLVLSQHGDCYAITDKGTGDQRQLCAGDFAQEMQGDLAHLPPEVATALQHLTSGMLTSGVGLVATQVDGKWYVSPIRSFGALLVAMVSGLQPSDIRALINLGH
ncbi:MAG TPA: flagellar basal body protein FliL [Pseudonocardiaceae bacterium]|nr:flagellar basal body protein FliL [Pseudonocardiaceae bacterium]